MKPLKDEESCVGIYSRPHVMEDGSIAFIMRDRLSHKKLESKRPGNGVLD
ncbi:MAG: hypothetical protein GY737_24255 [Desulfobacteraceae bacterium]|nr:hypothetical protein [Desulfobacteraceae bacterium]